LDDMELDDFKAHWNRIQEKELSKQKYTPETLNRIVMNTTNTLTEMQKKNAFWNNMAKAICPMLLVILVIFIPISYFIPNKQHTFTEALIYIAIMATFAWITLWMYDRQEKIFKIYNSENLKETLQRTIAEFKKFYITFNVVYIFLYPLYYYSMFKLLITYWVLPTQTLLLICGGLSIISLIAGHIYYKITYFKRIRTLQADLKELED
jgi:hypothetical protein